MENLTATQINSLSAVVASERFSTGASNRKLRLHDISPHEGQLPAAVIWPESTENEAVVNRAIEKGRTCTGEQGIGIGKRKYMEKEHGQSCGVMKQIKALLDPKGLMDTERSLNSDSGGPPFPFRRRLLSGRVDGPMAS